ncbi:membrane protein YhcE [Roseibium sp. TrichSKD4]|uniref:MarC family protein n=1 Tax=Roseibium sp. TrichSKD4 TaxID=744980 RepID=UPI0001E56C09|nr:MarC family protein [Roseibium sp. TrichSKD4]EFO33171.1 membrane protein YhcE [Roseibium sp. TrichSKD4]
MDTAFFLKMFAALFAIMNPIANLPVFLSLTSDRDAAGQRKVVVTLIIALVCGAALVGIGGNAILNLFGISVDAFRLAGGFLILLIALNLIQGEQSKAHHGTEAEQAHHAEQDHPAIYPLTVPILLGPGTISTMIIFRGQASTVEQDIAYVAAISCAIGLLAVTFFAAPFLGRVLGQTATSVMSRLMGMILAAIAMSMMVESLKVLLPGLA